MRQIKPRAAPQNQVVQSTELGDAFRMTRFKNMTRFKTIASLFKTTASVLAFATTAIALQTSPGLAFSSEAQQMCSGDAMRLCSSEIPDIPRIRACMVRNKAQVSPGCRAVMDREHAASRKREAAAQ